MKNKIIFFLLIAIGILPGCSKNTAVEIKEWDQFQDPYSKISFNHPKNWNVATEPAKVIVSSSAEAAEKFFDHDSRKTDGVQIIIASERNNAMQGYSKFIQNIKTNKTAEGYVVKEIENAKIEGLDAKKVSYTGVFDEKTKIETVCIATLKDSAIYYVQYSAFNDLFEQYQGVFDSVLASLTLPKKIVREKGVNQAIPYEQVERYSDKYLQLEYPANFGASDMPKKGDVMSAVRFMGTDRDSRMDCTIDIDVRPTKGLTLDKVVDQNLKRMRVTGGGGRTTISGQSSKYFNETPRAGIERRTYFVVKNDKFYRVMLTYYVPMKRDFMPAFEKVVASIRLK